MADQTPDMTEPTLQTMPQDGFGAILKRAREAQGISLGDMAARSRLSVQQLRAIESERVDELPEPVYVRAFLRGIASVLELDPEPIVADYAARFGTATVGLLPDHDPATETIVRKDDGRRLGVNLGILVLVVAAAAAGAWAYFSGGDDVPAEQAPVVEAVKPAEPTAVAPEPAPTEPAVKPADTAEAPTDAQPEVATPAVVEQPAPEAKPEPAKPEPVAKTGGRHMTLRTSGQCWVQVVGPNGRNLFAKEMAAGDVERLEVPAGSRVTVGNARVMKLTLDGEPFELTKVTRGGICRFNVK